MGKKPPRVRHSQLKGPGKLKNQRQQWVSLKAAMGITEGNNGKWSGRENTFEKITTVRKL